MSNPVNETAARPAIAITVTGGAKTGKSAIAMFLQKCLANVGIEATIFNEDTDPAALEETFQKRLRAVVDSQPEVVIAQQQTAHRPAPTRRIVLLHD